MQQQQLYILQVHGSAKHIILVPEPVARTFVIHLSHRHFQVAILIKTNQFFSITDYQLFFTTKQHYTYTQLLHIFEKKSITSGTMAFSENCLETFR